MKKGYIVAGVVLLVIIILVVSGVGTYNTMVAGEETINGEWAKVETQYQRRSDLIPNLVSTVKGYAAHEQSTLDAVVSARAKATQVTLSADNLTPEISRRSKPHKVRYRVHYPVCWLLQRIIPI